MELDQEYVLDGLVAICKEQVKSLTKLEQTPLWLKRLTTNCTLTTNAMRQV
jgi:hypothetical protein